MAKHALSLFIKIVLFAVVVLIVAEMVPYDGLVNSIMGLLISRAPTSLPASFWVNLI